MKWGSELVPHCWHAVIDTVDEELSFSQNLIYSKDLGPKGVPELISERIVGREPNTDKSHVRGDFILLERQIKNGVLTHALLTALQNYSSSREWGELLVKVRVKAALVFPKSLMIDYKGRETFVDWIKSLRSKANSNRVRTMANQTGYCVTDQRVGPYKENAHSNDNDNDHDNAKATRLAEMYDFLFLFAHWIKRNYRHLK